MNKIRFVLISNMLIISINFLWSQTIAKWHTSMGEFEVMMREDLVPITVGNFVDLTNSNFYDNLIFHRVINDFMIQDGCPLGTGTGGPGYTIPDEYHEAILFNSPGVIGMAKTSAPNSAGSQYFITELAYPSLNWNYAAFGNVIEGFEVIEAISDVPTDANDKPLIDVVIDSIRIMTPQLDNFFPYEDTLYVNTGESTGFGLLCDDDDITYSWYVDDELQQTTNFALTLTLTVNGWYEVKGVISNENYDLPKIWWVEIIGGTEATVDIVCKNAVLYQNVPNPFNPETNIKFNLVESGHASLEIYNIKGQLVKTLANDNFPAGEHNFIWNGKDGNGNHVVSGIFFYNLRTKNISVKKKAILLK